MLQRFAPNMLYFYIGATHFIGRYYMAKDHDNFEQAYLRERHARQLAEDMLKNKVRELYIATKQLQNDAQSSPLHTAEIELLYTVSKFSQEEISLEKALQLFIQAVCKLCKWQIGHAFILNNTDEIISLNIWHLADSKKYKKF